MISRELNWRSPSHALNMASHCAAAVEVVNRYVTTRDLEVMKRILEMTIMRKTLGLPRSKTLSRRTWLWLSQVARPVDQVSHDKRG